MKRFSVIVPFYQNELNIPHTLPRLFALAQILKQYELEFIFIEDGSQDKTFATLEHYTRNTPHLIKVIKLTKNFGQIAAIRAGLSAATGDCAGIISADLQDPPELFREMLQQWEQGFKLVIAERAERQEGRLQILLSSTYWNMVRKFALPKYPTGGFDFCLIDRAIVQDINNLTERNTQIFPLIFSLGYSFTKIPYKRERREHGESQWTTNMKVKLFLDTFIAFSYLPIRLISAMGVFIALLSLCYGAFMAISYFVYGNSFTGWTTLVVLISTLGGMTLVTLGIIGEYLWRILDQVRRRPLYVIDHITKVNAKN